MKIAQLSFPFCITEDGRVWEWHSCGSGCASGWYKAESAVTFYERTIAENEALLKDLPF